MGQRTEGEDYESRQVGGKSIVDMRGRRNNTASQGSE